MDFHSIIINACTMKKQILSKITGSIDHNLNSMNFRWTGEAIREQTIFSLKLRSYVERH